MAQRRGWGRLARNPGMLMAHGGRASQILQHGCSEGLGTVSALSPRQHSGQCPVSETTENLKGGEVEKKLPKAQESTGCRGPCPPRLSQALTPTEKQQPLLHTLVWPSDAAIHVALCEGFARQPARGLPTEYPKAAPSSGPLKSGTFSRTLEWHNSQKSLGVFGGDGC